ncbi:MAG: hypothetical protein WD114_04570, partial [Phycisphaerales bacterium]
RRMQLGPTPPSEQTVEQPPSTPENAREIAPGVTSELETAPVPMNWIEQIRAENPLLPSILLVCGVVLLVLVMVRSLKRNTRADRIRSNNLGSPSERIADIHDRAQSSMDPGRKLMVEAEEIARRVGATLDNKAARLELLIEEADARLEELNRKLAASQLSKPTSPQPQTQNQNQAQPHETPPSPRTLDPTLLDRARIEQDMEERQGRVLGRIEPQPPAAAAKPDYEPQSDPENPPAAEPESIHSRIRTLADSGLTSSEIARNLDQPIGQVELVLNLHRQQKLY